MSAMVQSCYTPLHMAVHNGKLDFVKLMISRGADVNTCNKV